MGVILIGFNLFLVAVCGYAIMRGGAPERWAGAACLIAAAATFIAPLSRPVFRSLEIEILVIDLALLAVLLTLALKADRYWPIWATAAHSVAVSVHLARAANPELVWPVYAFASSGSSLAVLAILWLGTLRHRRRLRSHGTDPPWRASSPS